MKVSCGPNTSISECIGMSFQCPVCDNFHCLCRGCQKSCRKQIEVLDSVRAKKALECVQELKHMILENLVCDSREDRKILLKYGFINKLDEYPEPIAEPG